jgi:A/G-specific adenine glycosylase
VGPTLESALQQEIGEPLEQVLDVDGIQDAAAVLRVRGEPHEFVLPLPARRIRAVRRALLDFYDRERRDLPWRRTADPYRVWISEIMLQQTRVDVVIPYYERWLDLFPTVQALASAAGDDVMRAWEGLGYYSRARNLHRAAAIVRERYHGRVPADLDALRALPGIGDYTAGAIASIAYGVRAPAVDGNVRRVLCRLLDEADPPPARLRDSAAALVPRRRAGDFNQALMELGATVCTPAAPACHRCPVSAHCRARANGTQLVRPARKPDRAVPRVDVATAVLLHDGRVLLTRPASGLLAGLWAFPSVPLGAAGPVSAATALARSLGLRTASPDPLGTVDHTFTHRKERYHLVRLCVTRISRAKLPASGEFLWADTASLDALALPVAQRRIARIAVP